MPLHIVQGWKVRTDCVQPPIPVRDFDWCAVLHDYYDGAPDYEGAPRKHNLCTVIGTGATEEKAIDDLLEQVDQLQQECA